MFGIVLTVGGLLTGQTAYSAGIARQEAGDPILDVGPHGPCDPHTDGADYVAGTDVNGHPVAPADLPGAANPVPKSVLVPLKSGNSNSAASPAYVQADGDKLDALLNPPPACPVPAAAR